MKGSPYIGVFCSVTEDIAIVPTTITQKETSVLEKTLGVSAVRAGIGNSSLAGILMKGIGKKFAVTELIEREEERVLEKHGLELFKIQGGFTSTGNLISMNKNGGIASPLLSDRHVEALEEFFGIKFEVMKIADNDVCGASITVTNKGFICHPNISDEAFSGLERVFGVKGMATTANFGDMFVGNSMLANSKGAVAGINTSGIELSKIDEGLRGD